VAGVAWGGVVLGHLLGYALTYPSSGARHAHLALTGHGFFGIALSYGAVALPVALVLTAMRALSERSGFHLRRTVVWLATAQLLAFALMELAERHFSAASALSDPAVLVGLALQLIVAVLSAVLLGAFFRTVRTLAVRLRRRHQAPGMSGRPAPRDAVIDRLAFLIGARRRAPPLPLHL
jgi:uncharacterized PurR-regulated membrane protein YhhQ (DUF165 family)